MRASIRSSKSGECDHAGLDAIETTGAETELTEHGDGPERPLRERTYRQIVFGIAPHSALWIIREQVEAQMIFEPELHARRQCEQPSKCNLSLSVVTLGILAVGGVHQQIEHT